MHELSIAMSIVDIASDEAERLGGGAVLAVHVNVGEFSGVAEQALRAAFELARERTPLDGAQLVIEIVPIAALCPSCGVERPVRSIQDLSCGICGAFVEDIVRGKELQITAMEIES